MSAPFDPNQDSTLGKLSPPTPAECAFDEYLGAVDAGKVVDTAAFVREYPEGERRELEGLIDDWNGLRNQFGGEEDLIPGTCSGGYQVLSLLGKGGMGSVYAALHLETNREAALKILSKEHRYSDEAWARFERESRLAAGINHPRCVFVYEVVDFEGRPAIAMERMSGGTLQDEISGGDPLPVERAVDLILQVLEGLEAAHAAGVLHRDVKPANCFLDGDGGVKVGDFGIARCLTHKDVLTGVGQFLGSPLYAAPEQIRGDAVDERTDVYSVGATLFALLAGAPPFSGEGLGEVISHVLADPVPSARALNPAVPRELDRILRRTLSKNSASRPASVDLLIEELLPFSSSRMEHRKWRGLAGLLEGGRWNSFFRWMSSFVKGSEFEPRILDTDYARSKSQFTRLGRFQILGLVAPTMNGEYFLAHDNALDRRLWIHIYEQGIVPGPPSVAGEAVLRWIEDGEEDGQHWRAFEDPGGVPLKTYAIRRTPIPWSRLRESLVQLCENLEGENPVEKTSELWVDRFGRLRILECAVDRQVEQPLGPLRLIQRVAETFLMSRDGDGLLRPGYSAQIVVLQQWLTDSVSKFRSVSEVRTALNLEYFTVSGLSRQQRLAPLLLLLSGMAVVLLLRASSGSFHAEPFGGAYDRPIELAAWLSIVCSMIFGFVTRSSLWCWLAGMEIRSMDGRLPSRVTCAVRAFLTTGAALLLLLACFREDGSSNFQGWFIITGLLTSFPIVGFPSQTGIDRALTDTYVVGCTPPEKASGASGR